MMRFQSIKKSLSRHSIFPFLLPVLIALAFFVFTFSYHPFREKIQFNTDEGFNVMRSMLVVLGYPLYLEVSSDQPPLFTHLLGLVFRISGFELNAARLLVLLFSTLLVWACAQFLQNTWGKLAAILFLPIVIMVPSYLLLSVSVMIGLPSISLSVVSMLFLANWHEKQNHWWLVASGFALGLSILIKLFTGFLAPLFLVGITLSLYLNNKTGRFSWRLFLPAVIWGLSFVFAVAFLGIFLVGVQNVWQIVLPHLSAPGQDEFQIERLTINHVLQAAIPLILLGCLGVITIFRKKKWLLLYPLAWAASIYLLLNFYAPVWPHHQLLVTVPVTILAAVALADAVSWLFSLKQSGRFLSAQAMLGMAAFLVFVWVSGQAIPVLDEELMDSPRVSGFLLKGTPGKMRLIRTMEEHIDKTHWIVTDMPIYAFIVKRPVPPILATFSQKRLSTGSLTDQDILAAMRNYRPEQVLVARFDIPALEGYLQEHYTLITSPETFRLYLRNDLVP